MLQQYLAIRLCSGSIPSVGFLSILPSLVLVLPISWMFSAVSQHFCSVGSSLRVCSEHCLLIFTLYAQSSPICIICFLAILVFAEYIFLQIHGYYEINLLALSWLLRGWLFILILLFYCNYISVCVHTIYNLISSYMLIAFPPGNIGPLGLLSSGEVWWVSRLSGEVLWRRRVNPDLSCAGWSQVQLYFWFALGD